VFQIVVEDHQGKQFHGTGFRVNSPKANGILTALHVVAGAKNITASNTNSVIKDLKIAAVNWSHDVALLTSPNDTSQSGFELADQLPGQNSEVLTISARTDFQDSKLAKIALKPLHQLNESLTDVTIVQDFNDRKGSPTKEAEVLVLVNAGLGPGDSGSPVLNLHQQVVGMYEGGFFRYLEYWAIPADQILQLEPEEKYHQRIEALPTSGPLFHSVVDEKSVAASDLSDFERSFIGRWKPATLFLTDLGGSIQTQSVEGSVEITAFIKRPNNTIGKPQLAYRIKAETSAEGTLSYFSFSTHSKQTMKSDAVGYLDRSSLIADAAVTWDYDYFRTHNGESTRDLPAKSGSGDDCVFEMRGGQLIMYLARPLSEPTGHNFHLAMQFTRVN
jgi:hypothetical protein